MPNRSKRRSRGGAREGERKCQIKMDALKERGRRGDGEKVREKRNSAE